MNSTGELAWVYAVEVTLIKRRRIVFGCVQATVNRAMMEDRWFSVDEIAAYLGIKRDTVYRWIAEKRMPVHRMGRLWKFRKEEVDEWVRSGGADEVKSQEE